MTFDELVDFSVGFLSSSLKEISDLHKGNESSLPSVLCCKAEASYAMLFLADYCIFSHHLDQLRAPIHKSLLSYLDQNVFVSYTLNYFDIDIACDPSVLSNHRMKMYGDVISGNCIPQSPWYLGDRDTSYGFLVCMALGDFLYILFMTDNAVLDHFPAFPAGNVFTSAAFYSAYFDVVFRPVSSFLKNFESALYKYVKKSRPIWRWGKK